jgi:predicted HD phosphohydrolase
MFSKAASTIATKFSAPRIYLRILGEAVTKPIRMHVEAKRYLCAIDPEYLKLLSPASIWSLELQGGPFAASKRDEFIKRPFAAEGSKLRRWDESAKIDGLQTPNLAHFRPYVEACLSGQCRPLRFTNWPRAFV